MSDSPTVTGTRLPLVLAPMAGGPTTPALCAAVSAAGGLPFLPGGYLDADSFAAKVDEVDRMIDGPFGVNLFVPDTTVRPDDGTGHGDHADDDAAAYTAYRELIIDRGFARPDQLPVDPVRTDDDYPRKLDLAIAGPARFISFTFGHPDPADVDRVHRAGKVVVLTATTFPGVDAALAAGADILTVQGTDAGGHRASVPGADDDSAPTAGELTVYAASLDPAVRRPVFAGGGVSGPGDVQDLLAAGAAAVQVGTMFLLADEAGTRSTHRRAIIGLHDRGTVVTRAFTGRPARAVDNRFIRELDASAPALYPELHYLTAGLRGGADRRADPESLNLWAGTGYRAATPGPAADIVRRLCPDDRPDPRTTTPERPQ